MKEGYGVINSTWKAQNLIEGHTVKCPIMSQTKSSHSGHYETSGPPIWDITRLDYTGTVWNHSGHYGTFSRDITRLCGKIFFAPGFPPPFFSVKIFLPGPLRPFSAPPLPC